jgi:hypothetical protein
MILQSQDGLYIASKTEGIHTIRDIKMKEVLISNILGLKYKEPKLSNADSKSYHNREKHWRGRDIVSIQ